MTEYIYKTDDDKVINLIHYKLSQNKKLGENVRLIGTYHFSSEQLSTGDFTLDKDNCLDCPLSFSSGKSKCYTHKGFQRLGLISMLGRLSKLYNEVDYFNDKTFNKFLGNISKKNPELCRLGIYGEPVLMSPYVIEKLISISDTYTGYSHQYKKSDKVDYSQFLMASTHSKEESDYANSLGWRSFNTGLLDGHTNCPASKEAGYKTTCSNCNLCSGTLGKGKKNVWINIH